MTELPVGSPRHLPDPTPCRDGCGNSIVEPEKHGWTHLQITGWWRCPTCNRQTEAFKAEQEKTNDAT